ncbi:Protein ECERIFERUM 3 [Platanthera zijinensis]|uniref:aldehyde oxygenase (deformylating) n=1 Tax=Platanthera zijinensis TaxID=2320716 RepID=A0AAP0BWM9_9ASPA
MVFYLFPSSREFPLWDLKGLFIALLLHVAVSEPLFYWTHRAFHSEQLFGRYHTLHHSSPIPNSFTGTKFFPHCNLSKMLTKRKRRVLKLWMLLSSSSAGHGTPLEHLVMSLAMMVPLLGASFVGAGSVGLYYAYVLFFDFLRCMGHSNVEVFPGGLFEAFPFLRYLIYTPT